MLRAPKARWKAKKSTPASREPARQNAAGQQRPYHYVRGSSASFDKEQWMERIVQRDHIQQGLIAVLAAVEPCTAMTVRPNHQTQRLEPVHEFRKCLRQGVGINGIKIYDKLAQLLRVETTLNAPEVFKVYRKDPAQSPHPKHKKTALKLPCPSPPRPAAASASKPPLTAQSHIYPLRPASPQQARRTSAAVSRKLRLLRAHGLIKKIPGSHRYLLTVEGRKLITLLMAARKADIEQLTAFAA